MQLDVATFLTMVMLWTRFIPTKNQLSEEHTTDYDKYSSDVPLLSSVLANNLLDGFELDSTATSDAIAHEHSRVLLNQIKALLKGQILEKPTLFLEAMYEKPKTTEDKYFKIHGIDSLKLPKRLLSLRGDTSILPPENLQKRGLFNSRQQKRQFPLEIAQQVCPALTAWKPLHWARDITDTIVKVLQPPDPRADGKQYFYTNSCFNTEYQSRRACPDCCIGINNQSFSSACLQKKSYVLAHISREKSFGWGFIQVNSSCNCAIAPRI